MWVQAIRVALLLSMVAGLAIGLVATNAQTPSRAAASPALATPTPAGAAPRAEVTAAEGGTRAGNPVASLAIGVVYSQPPSPTGGLLKSSRQIPNDTDADRDVWEGFVFTSAQTVTEVRWRGGYDPAAGGSGGPVVDFEVAFYPSVAGGAQPDVLAPLVQYQTGGNAGQTAAGTFGGTPMYDYHFVLPTSFAAAAGTKYWLRVTALQQGTSDWGLSVGTGGDGYYYRRISVGGGSIYQTMNGDAAFDLLGPVNVTNTPTPAHGVYLPAVMR